MIRHQVRLASAIVGPPLPPGDAPHADRVFRYGIEHESALLRADGRFADPTNTSFGELQAVVDALPEDPSDLTELRLGDQGIKRKRWYVEGYERFDERGRLVRCDPKGIEIRTRIHRSVEDTVAALRADQAALAAAARRHDLHPVAIGFNPVRSPYVVDPPLNAWERRHRLGSPEERTAHLHMSTFGPDLSLSWNAPDPAELVDVGRKLTAYSPYLVPLSFSSPFEAGAPWGGLSARTRLRTGPRPAVLVFLPAGAAQVRSDPSLTQPARLAPEVGRVEFKAFDPCPDPSWYGDLLALLTGLVLDRTLPGRRTTPDAALHRRSAGAGLDDPTIRAGTCRVLDAAIAALAGRPGHLARLEALYRRVERRECPAATMIERYRGGETIADVLRAP